MNEVAYPTKQSSITTIFLIAAITLFIGIPLIYFHPEKWMLRLGANLLQIAIIAIAVVFALIAIVVEMYIGTKASEERLRGWAKLRRILFWYGGMAVVGFAGLTGNGEFRGVWRPWEGYLSDSIPLFAICFCYFNAWAMAMIVYIALDGPLLRDREIKRLPKRSAILLSIYSITSFAWFAIALKSLEYHNNAVVIVPLILNVFAVGTLWAAWALIRHRCDAREVILFNTGLICWLFWFAHPMIVTRDILF